MSYPSIHLISSSGRFLPVRVLLSGRDGRATRETRSERSERVSCLSHLRPVSPLSPAPRSIASRRAYGVMRQDE